ncbi:MAG: hypothetical protein J6X55_12505 [Victivallales bacterium]|nr:hypothetical protein [Victivallales bacterium]
MKNDVFTIEFNASNGTVASLVLNDDPDRMNWVEGMCDWGQPVGMDFVSMTIEDNEVRSLYRKETLELEVVRTLSADSLTERFIYRNTGYYDLYFERGGLGIYTTFNDSYEDSDICIHQRCDAHVWCGGGYSYVHAMKMGPFHTDIALVLTQGALDCYSVERVMEESSNDRGDIVLHPASCHLLPHDEMALEWKLIAFPHGHFQEVLLAMDEGLWVEFKRETVFPGEKFELTVTSNHIGDDVSVVCKGHEIPYVKSGKRLVVEYLPQEQGEHRFDFRMGEKRFCVFGYSCTDFDELLEKRVRFILSHQQMLDSRSPLYGAFMIYDNEENCQYYNYRWGDHNANGERIVMGFLVCKWAQLHPEDVEAAKAIDLFEKYLLREIYDVETGIVHRNIGKQSTRIRLYDAAGLINFWLELYRLKKKDIYLQWIARSIRQFYSAGGFHFYPNGTLFSDAIGTIREAGFQTEAEELTALLRKHVMQMCATGLNYPPHEVRFEQTIATPAVAIPAAYYSNVEKNPDILCYMRSQIDLLSRFSGDQPDYRLNEIPIRHWDEYWFGKRRVFGDTCPQQCCCLTARSYRLYSMATNDGGYREKAAKCLRNCLCLFSPDGRASCAYLYPFSVTMRHKDGSICTPRVRGEFFDPFANDQDSILYVILCMGGREALM